MMQKTPSGAINAVGNQGGVGSIPTKITPPNWGGSTTPQTDQMAQSTLPAMYDHISNPTIRRGLRQQLGMEPVTTEFAASSVPAVPVSMKTLAEMRTPAATETLAEMRTPAAMRSKIAPSVTPTVDPLAAYEGVNMDETNLIDNVGLASLTAEELGAPPSAAVAVPQQVTAEDEGDTDYTQLARELGIDIDRSGRWDPYEYMAVMGPKMMSSGSTSLLGALGEGMDAASTHMMEKEAANKEWDYKLRLKQWEQKMKEENKKKEKWKGQDYTMKIGGVTYEMSEVDPEALAHIDVYDKNGEQQLFTDPTRMNVDGTPRVYRRNVTSRDKPSKKDKEYLQNFSRHIDGKNYTYNALHQSMPLPPSVNEQGEQIVFTFEEYKHKDGTPVHYTRNLTSVTTPSEESLKRETDDSGTWVEAPNITQESYDANPDQFRQFPSVHGDKWFHLMKSDEGAGRGDSDRYTAARATMVQDWADTVASRMGIYKPQLSPEALQTMEGAKMTMMKTVTNLLELQANPEFDEKSSKYRNAQNAVTAAEKIFNTFKDSVKYTGHWYTMGRKGKQGQLIMFAEIELERALAKLQEEDRTSSREKQEFMTIFENMLNSLGLGTDHQKNPEFLYNPYFDKATQDTVLGEIDDLTGGGLFDFNLREDVITERGAEQYEYLMKNPSQLHKFQAHVMQQAQRIADSNQIAIDSPQALTMIQELAAHSINGLFGGSDTRPAKFNPDTITRWMSEPAAFKDDYPGWVWEFNKKWNGGKGAWGWTNKSDTTVDIGTFHPIPESYNP